MCKPVSLQLQAALKRVPIKINLDVHELLLEMFCFYINSDPTLHVKSNIVKFRN